MNIINEKEKKLIVAMSRINPSKTEIQVVNQLIDQKLNWEYIFNVTYKNKIHLLVFNNLYKFNIEDKIYRKYETICKQLNYSNKLKNELKYKELDNLMMKINSQVDIVPVKGAYLIRNVYEDLCIRSTNDFDFLIRRKDISKVDSILKSIGYQQGQYNKFQQNIISFTPEKRMLYKTKMYNLLPYIKLINHPILDIMTFDISHSLDFSLNNLAVDEMISSAEKEGKILQLLPEHFFIHMCCHHYREASHASWIMLGNDLNLIKFCDVREFVLKKMNNESREKAIKFAKKHRLEKAVYFTMYFVREIYNDGYEPQILEQLDIQDEKFLYEYGENEFNQIQTRKKDFWTSLFSESNIDELSEKPKYDQLI